MRALQLALKGKTESLEELLTQSDIEFLASDFNFANQDEESSYLGNTVFWMACLHSGKEEKSGLLKHILSLPDSEFQHLNFNAVLRDGPYQGLGILWFACRRALKSQPDLLEKILRLPDAVLQGLDFSAAVLEEGVNILWYACQLAIDKNQFDLLEKMLSLPEDQFNALDFNSIQQTSIDGKRGVNVLWMAAELADEGKPELLAKIMKLPDTEFNALNFDVTPLDSDNYDRGVSVFWIAAKLALKGKSDLLTMIFGLPKTKFETLNFDAAPMCIIKLDDVGNNLVWMAVRLANEGQAELLKRIFSLPNDTIQALSFQGQYKNSFRYIPCYLPELIKTIISLLEKESIDVIPFICAVPEEAIDKDILEADEIKFINVLRSVVDEISTLLEDTDKTNRFEGELDTILDTAIERIESIENSPIKNSVYTLLAIFLTEKCNLVAFRLLENITEESPQLYADAAQIFANYRLMRRIDTLDQRLSDLETAMKEAITAYRHPSDERDLNLQFCINLSRIYRLTREDNFCSTPCIYRTSEDDTDSALINALEGKEISVEAIIELMKEQRSGDIKSDIIEKKDKELETLRAEIAELKKEKSSSSAKTESSATSNLVSISVFNSEKTSDLNIAEDKDDKSKIDFKLD